MKWEEAIIVGLVSLIVVVIGLIIEYRTGFFHPTDSKGDRSILGRIKALKPKPRLGITVRDINCYVTKKMLEKKVVVGVSQSQARVTRWWVELTAKVENKGKVTATNVQWRAQLTLGQGDNTFSFPEISGKAFNLAKKELHPLKISFPHVDLSQEVSRLYPNSPYCLKYIYSCAERSHPKEATASGELTKADWMHDPWVGDPESLQAFKNMGFHE